MEIKNIKCLHIITRISNGGAEESLFDLVSELSKKKVYCDIAVGKSVSPEFMDKSKLPEQCTLFRIPHMIKTPSPIWDLIAVQEIRRLIKKGSYHIVQTHGSKAGILGRIAAHQEKVSIIIGMIHGISFPQYFNFFSRQLYRAIEKYTATLSDTLVFVGKDLMHTYQHAGVGTPDSHHLIYTGMKLEPYTQVYTLKKDSTTVQKRKIQFGIPIHNDTIMLASVGRLDEGKNQQALIKMLPRVLQNHKVHLCLIGDGPDEKKLKTLAKTLCVHEHVSFLGYITKMWEVLPAIDIHCMVSLREGLPRTLVQTSAAGIPNICYRTDGTWEIIDHGHSGFIIAMGDEEDYIEKLSLLIKDKSLRNKFGDKAVQIADSRWSLENFCNETLALYKKCIMEKQLSI